MTTTQLHQTTQVHQSAALGCAALSICEALLGTMIARGLLSEKDVADLLSDAADTHRQASKLADNPELHAMVATIIEDLAAKKTSTRGRRETSAVPSPN